LQSVFYLTISYLKTLKYTKTRILSIVLNGCETWSLTPKEEHRLRVFENRVLRRIFQQKREKWQEAGEGCIMSIIITCTLHKILLG
jgi:hypothetical protein